MVHLRVPPRGFQYTVDFGRAPRGAHDVAVERYRAVASRRRQVRADWPGGGASFLITSDGDKESVLSWTVDGDDASLAQSIVLEQALGELEVSLGRDHHCST